MIKTVAIFRGESRVANQIELLMATSYVKKVPFKST
jgi:hypothetical protein